MASTSANNELIKVLATCKTLPQWAKAAIQNAHEGNWYKAWDATKVDGNLNIDG